MTRKAQKSIVNYKIRKKRFLAILKNLLSQNLWNFTEKRHLYVNVEVNVMYIFCSENYLGCFGKINF